MQKSRKSRFTRQLKQQGQAISKTIVVVGPHVGDLHAVGWGEGPMSIVDPSKSLWGGSGGGVKKADTKHLRGFQSRKGHSCRRRKFAAQCSHFCFQFKPMKVL